MRWSLVTAGLLTASVCLAAGIYLRDRDTSGWQPPESQMVRADAAVALNALSGAECRSGCATELLGRTRSHRWLVRVTVSGRRQCLQIDPDTFAFNGQHGLSGVQPSHCGPGQGTASGGDGRSGP